jgi:hypothetical protein
MDFSIVHLQELIAALGETAIVRCHQQSDSLGGNNVEQEGKYGCARLFIERSSGFVGEQDLRSVHQRATERGALPFAARKFLYALMQAMTEARALGQLTEAILSVVAIRASSDRGDKTIFFESEVRNKVMQLEDKPDFVAKQAQ